MSRPAHASLRRATVEIDHDALRHNLARVRDCAPESRVMAVIKADAYGHGMIDAATALDDADMFGVAMTAEALALREAGIDKPLVVLHGFQDSAELTIYSEQSLTGVVHTVEQAQLVLSAGLEQALDVWLKLDTGMHRLGLSERQLEDIYPLLRASSNVAEIVLMSHFANADFPENKLNNKQIESIHKVNSIIGVKVSLANSAAIVALPATRLDIVRPGIMLYGSSPLADTSAAQLGLLPVMQFEAPVLAIKQVAAGESIGYGSTWTCDYDTRVAIIAAGYADGYPRHARNGTPVWLNGVRCPLLGRVSMDSICVSVDAVDARVGDRAVLWGRELDVDEVATCSETIAYELLCQAGAARRQYAFPE